MPVRAVGSQRVEQVAKVGFVQVFDKVGEGLAVLGFDRPGDAVDEAGPQHAVLVTDALPCFGLRRGGRC
jgi:hypothetical protein